MKKYSTNGFKLVVGVVMIIASTATFGQNVGINASGALPDASAILDVSSSNKGFLAPRVADTNSIVTPVEALMVYDLSSHCYRYYTDVSWTACLLGDQTPAVGIVTALDCADATISGVLEDGIAATSVSFTLEYTDGNEGVYAGEVVASTGVTGLSATLNTGVLANGSGSVVYSITGTPSSVGFASFTVNLGGQACVVDVEVYATGMVPVFAILHQRKL